jgi:acyl carrier protein
MQIKELVDEYTEQRIKELIDERLRGLVQDDQPSKDNEWNDAIDSARWIVTKS